MGVKHTLKISLPEKVYDVNELEEAIFEALREAGRELLRKELERWDRELIQSSGEGVAPQKRVERSLLSRFGEVRFLRTQVLSRVEGRWWYMLDQVLALRPYQRVTPWVERRGTELATLYPYRQAAELLSQEIGYEVSHRTIHNWVEREGKRLEEQEAREWERLLEERMIEEEEREIVVIEADATLIHAQGEETDNLEVKVGLLYSGKELESRTAKRKRYRLKEKRLYATLEGAESFGRGLYLTAARKLEVERAKHLLLLGDGAAWIRSLWEMHFSRAIYQLDHWHLRQKLRGIEPQDSKWVDDMMELLWKGELERVEGLLRSPGRVEPQKGERIEQLIRYLEENREAIFGVKVLQGKVEAKEVLVVGSGAVEKSVDLLICRRFKGRGMSWSKRGANRLLLVKLLREDVEAWGAWWNPSRIPVGEEGCLVAA